MPQVRWISSSRELAPTVTQHRESCSKSLAPTLNFQEQRLGPCLQLPAWECLRAEPNSVLKIDPSQVRAQPYPGHIR